MRRRTDTESGFTLIELLFSVATIAVIAGIGIPVYLSFSARNDLDIAATTLAQSYWRARTLAAASDGDSPWGVATGSGAVTLFKGASYATRDPSYDERYDLAGSVTVSGVSSVVFAKFTGVPQTTGTTTFANGSGARTLFINAQGTVTY